MLIYQLPIEVDVDGTLYPVFPERADKEWLDNAAKDKKRAFMMACQWYLNPVSAEDRIFDLNSIKYFNKVPYGLRILICVDPATTTNKSSDYTAITVMGWDTQQNWYILDIYRDKLGSEVDRSKKLFAMHKKWSKQTSFPIHVLYESRGFQVSDKHYIERKQRETNYRFKVVEMSGGKLHNASKLDRITALSCYFDDNLEEHCPNVYIPKQCYHYSYYKEKNVDMTNELLNEIENVNINQTHVHDDILDTITFPLYWDGFRTVKGKDKPVKREPQPETFQDIINDAEMSDRRRKSYA